METLRGVFPSPKVPPKRDFLRENVMRIKALKKNQSKQSIQSKEQSYRTKRQSTNRTKVIARPKFQKALSEASIVTGRRDQSSQTIDIDNELFYKDVIIRYPSSAVLESLGSRRQSERKPIKFRQQFKDSSRSRGNLHHNEHYDEEDEHSSRINNNLTKLNEFLETGSITRRNNVPTIIKIDDHANGDNIRQQQQIRKGSQGHLSSYKMQNSPHYNLHSAYTNETNPVTVPNSPARFISCNSPNSDHSDNSETLQFSNLNVDDSNKDSKLKKQKNPKTSNLPSTYKLGQVPKYLKDRKENINREKDKANEYDPDCPPNHVALTENDRRDALELAKKKFKDLIDELNKMPMTAETLKIRKRKIEIEKELDTLEASIKVFSRPKVYVKIDE